MRQIIFTLIFVLFFCFSTFSQVENSLCAKIEVTGGGVVEPGTGMAFSTNVTGKTNNSNLEYEWKVSAGTIASGQGTPSIVIDTTGLANGTNITAEVKIKGLGENCAHTASETGGVSSTRAVCQCMIDEYGKLPNDKVKARMDALFITLGNEPNAQGYIINYGTAEEIAAREKQIQNAIILRKYEANRVTVVRGGENLNGTGVWTKVWAVPPGAEFPVP